MISLNELNKKPIKFEITSNGFPLAYDIYAGDILLGTMIVHRGRFTVRNTKEQIVARITYGFNDDATVSDLDLEIYKTIAYKSLVNDLFRE